MAGRSIILAAVLTFAALLLSLLTPRSAVSQMIDVKNYGGIPYISGGVGLDERQQLEWLGQSYSLKLVFAVRQGNFLADVNVVITTSGGYTVLEAISDGPWLFAQLPPGTYHVSATTLGKTIEKIARISRGKQTVLNFIWF